MPPARLEQHLSAILTAFRGSNQCQSAGRSDPGPKNPAINDQFPSVQSPSAADMGNMQLLWGSFNNTAQPIQNGGWSLR
ncbi:hypothetical protein [Rhizobium aegyptiacum]|uniref:hypothetical protein n=1 Tax=Rhizobium aegyptiacum TaxID=1764550 RepID=UPI000B33AAC0|nr:hypothetical protein [Rhizobium aegyptiacum]